MEKYRVCIKCGTCNLSKEQVITHPDETQAISDVEHVKNAIIFVCKNGGHEGYSLSGSGNCDIQVEFNQISES